MGTNRSGESVGPVDQTYPHKDQSIKSRLIGPANVHTVHINGVKVRALFDSGSMVTTISQEFVSSALSGCKVWPLSDVITISSSTGHVLPYDGYVEVQLCYKEDGIEKTQWVLALVVPVWVDREIPLLIGTNVFHDKIVDENECLVCCSTSTTVPPESVCLVQGVCQARLTGGMWFTGPMKNCKLPGGLQVIPSVVTVGAHSSVSCGVLNLGKESVEIPASSELCVLEAGCSILKQQEVCKDVVTLSQQVDTFDLSTIVDPLQRSQLNSLLEKWKHIFAHSDFELGKAKGVEHRIELEDPSQEPVRQRHRRIPPSMIEEVREHIKMMLECGVIQPSTSAWRSPVVLVRKKDQSLRFCVDYRKLNSLTKRDAYDLPCVEETIDSLLGAKFFSCIDLKSGYWQVPMAETDKHLTAFSVGPLGFFEFNVMPFGLSNSPATFQRAMERCMGDLHLSKCLIYLDDVIIFSKTFEEHLERLEAVFRRLSEFGFRLKPSKCQFLQREVRYLGHLISEKGIQVDPEKVECVKRAKPPKSKPELQSFLGFVGFCRKFIRNFALIARPLNDLMKKGVKFEWEENHQRAFDDLVEKMTSAPVLAFANFELPFTLHVESLMLAQRASVQYCLRDKGMRTVSLHMQAAV